MESEKRLFVVLTSLVSDKLSALMIAQNKVKKTQKELLEKADFFAEPLSERFNEFMDIIAVAFDGIKMAVFGTNEQNSTKTVETCMKVEIRPGIYARMEA